MRLTPRQLNRATLARQRLLVREHAPVVDTVRRLVALQAQEPASPYLALWNRLEGFDPAELDAAFADHAIVKAPLMRVTLHAVAAEDHRAFHGAVLTTLRGARLHDARFKATGLTADDADGLVPHLVAFASRPRSKDDIEAMLAEHLGSAPERGVWWALRTFAPLVHAPTSAPWSFGSTPAYVAAPRSVDGERDPAALERLIGRYLRAFGPASRQDFAQFALLRQTTVRPAFEAMAKALITFEGPDGAELFDHPGSPLPADDTPAPPRLMAMWDSVLLAHADRGRLIPPEYRSHVIRRNGDVLPTLLVDGYVAGVWRTVDEGIEVLTFHRLSDEAWSDVAAEARRLLAMLTPRDPAVYRRYTHWWPKLPSAEVRVIGAE